MTERISKEVVEKLMHAPNACKVFGKEGAEATRKAAEAAKAGGEHYCICDACQAGAEILREAGEV